MKGFWIDSLTEDDSVWVYQTPPLSLMTEQLNLKPTLRATGSVFSVPDLRAFRWTGLFGGMVKVPLFSHVPHSAHSGMWGLVPQPQVNWCHIPTLSHLGGHTRNSHRLPTMKTGRNPQYLQANSPAWGSWVGHTSAFFNTKINWGCLHTHSLGSACTQTFQRRSFGSTQFLISLFLLSPLPN